MTQTNEELQEHVRRLGSHLMRDGLTEQTVTEIVSFGEVFSEVPKANRAALYESAKQEARPKAKAVTVVDHPAASGAVGPILAKAPKSLGAQQSSAAATAPASCSCGGFVYNPTKIDGWVAKHEKKEGHVVTRR